MEPRRGGRRGGNYNRGGGNENRAGNYNRGGGNENRAGNYYRDGDNENRAGRSHHGARPRNFGYEDGYQVRGRAEAEEVPAHFAHHMTNLGSRNSRQGRVPVARHHQPTRSRGNNRGFRQGLSMEDIARTDDRGDVLRKNQDLYGSSQSIQSTYSSHNSESQHVRIDRRHNYQQVKGSQSKCRQSEVLFGDPNDEGKLGGADNSWVIISSPRKIAYEEDNVSIYSTESGDTHSSTHNSNYYSSNALSGARSKYQEKPAPPMSYDFPKIAIYWDIENCPVPTDKSALHLVKQIREIFCANTHTEDEFVVVCDTANQKKELLDQLSNALVDVQHINASCKNASDDMLRRKMNDFADRNSPPAKVVLITGDINFGPDIHKLNYKRHFRVVLIHNHQASEALRMHANECISYESFCQDLPSSQDMEAATKRISAVLHISNLPQHAPENRVRGQLYKLFNHFGGKVVSISKPPQTAVIKFAALSDARKAQARANGTDVHGKSMHIRLTHGIPPEAPTPNGSQSKNSPRASPHKDSPPKKTEKVDPPAGNICIVRFVIEGTPGVKELTLTLQPVLPLDDFTVLSTQNEQTCCSVKLPSLAKAKKTVKCLTSLKTVTVLSTEILKGDENTSKTSGTSHAINESPAMSGMQKLRNNFSKMKQAYLDRHEVHTKALKDKLWALREQMSTSEVCNTDPMIEAHEKAIISQLNVLSDVQKEFETKTEQLITVSLRSNEYDAANITNRIMVECHQFVSGSPVYALRSTIITKVSNANFVIVSGPPGMSKSTQVSQCLFYAEVCASGTTIACTQPYKELVTDRGAFVASQVKNALGKQVAFFKTRKTAPGNQHAQILYLPDHVLFEETLTDAKLTSYGCIVLDEVQERSLATELLLVYLQSLVKLRKELKVVILSTPSRASVLRRHLNRVEEVQLTVEPYPVDIIWQNSPQQDHVKTCIKMAMQVYLSEDTGDILIYFACAAEVAYAEELLSREMAKHTDIRIIQLVLSPHFKEVRKKLSQQSSVRNFVLTCNDLDDVIAIPSVQYVVDAGLSSESSWEEFQETIKIKYISQPVATMRANKAGVKTVGQCYRMYSPDHFTPSQNKGPQENEFSLMVLKLYLMDIDPRKYNYLESPNYTELETIIKQLQDIGAVNNGKLTSDGNKMATLPLPPHLSFLLLVAHKLNVGYPALILCAIASVAKSFTLPKVDRHVGEFPTGDLLSLIELFLKWFSLKVPDRRRLVADSRIDSFILDVIHDKVLELHDSLKNVDVRIKLALDSQHWKPTLTKLVRENWKSNLCILQNPNTRMYQWQLTKQNVTLLPSCCERNKPLPKIVIFEKLWKTPWGDFISNIFPLNESVMQESLELSLPLKLYPNDTVLRPIGPHLMRSLIVGSRGEKLSHWEKVLTDLAASPVSLKAFQSKGTVILNCPKVACPQILKKLQDTLESGRKLMLKERWEYGLSNYPGTRIHWGQNAEVLHVLLPEEFASVLAVVTESTPLNKVVTVCRKYGRTVHQNEKVTKHGRKQVVVMYETSQAAQRAVSCKEFDIRPMGKRMTLDKLELQFVHYTATWVRRKNLGTAVVDLKPDADFAVATVCMATEKKDGGCFDDVVMLAEEDKNRIIIKRLPQHVSRAELEEAVSHCLAKMTTSSVASISMTQEKAVESTEADIASATAQLRALFSHYEQKVFIAVRQPESRDDIWVATIAFEDEAAGQVMIDDLSHNASINNSPVCFKLNYQCSVKCNSNIFDHIKNKYVSIVTKKQSELGDKKMAVRATTDSLPETFQIVVNIHGHDISLVKSVYQELVRLLQDTTVVDLSLFSISDDLFGEDGAGSLFIQQKKTTSYASIALKKRKIAIYGKDALKTKHDIEEFLEVESAKLLSLPPQKVICSTTGLIRELVTRYGSTLHKLKDISEAYKLNLDVKEKILTCHGDSQAFQKILVAVMELKSKLRVGQTEDSGRNESLKEICPICLDFVFNADFRYRMEYCGHVYCEPCMVAHLETTTPPIKCLFANCDAPLVFRDLSGLQKTQNQRYPGLMERLSEKVVALYLEQNRDQLCFCPLPECEGIIRIGPETQLCTQCTNAVCSRCQVLYHYGYTCDEFQKQRKPSKTVNFKPTAAMEKVTNTQRVTVPQEECLLSSSFSKNTITNTTSARRTSCESSGVLSATSPTTTFAKKSFPAYNEATTKPSVLPPSAFLKTTAVTPKSCFADIPSVSPISPINRDPPVPTLRLRGPPASSCYTPATTDQPLSNRTAVISPTVLYPGRQTAAVPSSVSFTRSPSAVTTNYASSTTSYSTSSSTTPVFFPSRPTTLAPQVTSPSSYPVHRTSHSNPTTPAASDPRSVSYPSTYATRPRSSTSQSNLPSPSSSRQPQPEKKNDGCSLM